ncbi:MAG: hypothetical protein HOO91_06315 [Bacteroidales bacterium]|nr:hypothetical protein [Bacteroidales bacterium]
MKNLKELKGVKLLSKTEQKSIVGGYACRYPNYSCPTGSFCCNGLCRPNGSSCLD